MRFAFSNPAASVSSRRGGAPVGLLHELPAIELAAIVYLRAWCDGEPDRRIIAKDFRLVMGAAAGTTAVEDFDALMTLLLNNARRPMMRHGLGCKCFGGDESAFANMVAAAAGRDRDDALLFASTLVTGHAAWAAVQLAEPLGQVFLRLARAPDPSRAPAYGPEETAYKH